MTWERRVKSFVFDLHDQSDKPKDDLIGGVQMTVGEVHEWSILGPFPMKDYKKDGPAESFLENEEQVQPVVGQGVGEKKWKAFTSTMGNQGSSYGRIMLDLAMAYGMGEQIEAQNKPGKIEPLAAYAHSYVWSPEAGQARLRIVGTPCKAWLNGTGVKVPGQYEQSPAVELKKGWNSLMVKVGSTAGNWNVFARFSPIGPYQYESRNIRWMTQMPGAGWSSPIVVGDKLFVSTDMACLVCINKADGKILWIRSNGSYESLSEEERMAGGLKEQFGPIAQKLEEVLNDLMRALNETDMLNGAAAGPQENIRKLMKTKGDLENSLVSGLEKFDKKQFKDTRQHVSQSTGTPCSDGKFVYAAYLGSGKSDGAQTVSCYDLQGKKIWSRYFIVRGAEHGCHSSPLIVGDRLLFGSCGVVWCLDRFSGKTLWSTKKSWNEGSPSACKIGDEDVAFTPPGLVYRMSDGQVLFSCPENTQQSSPLLCDGMIFWTRSGYDLPAAVTDPLALSRRFRADTDDLGLPETSAGFGNAHIASPLLVDGLLYLLTESGGLVVYDAKAGGIVYRRLLDALNPRLTWVFNVGVCSSPVLAGKHIFITDDQSQTLVLEPGGQYKQVARNVVQSLTENGDQDQFESTIIAEGNRLYVHGQFNFYCIGDK